MTSLVLLSLHAVAAEVEMWAPGDFAEGEAVAGRAGWTNGWTRDEWLAVGTGSGIWAVPNLDEGDGTGGMGTGEAGDNYVVNEAEAVTQGAFLVTVYPDGNDAWAVVFGYQSADSYLAYLYCGELNSTGSSLCPRVDGAPDTPYTAIVAVRGGSVEALASSRDAFVQEQFGNVRVEINDGEIRASSDKWGDEVTAEAPPDAAIAGVGFYAYEQGYDGGGDDYGPTYFQAPQLFAFDDDDDGVIDDEDNCEKDKNADQEDKDEDGIGTACDDNESEGDADTDTDADGDADADADGDTDTDTNGGEEGEGKAGAEIEVAGGCGCATGPGGSQGAWAAMFALAAVALRRRRA